MADYALWGEACCSAWWPAGTFIEAYRRNRAEAVELSIEANPVASAIQVFMANRIKWSGTASVLLDALTAIVSETIARSRGWPVLPHILSGQLRRAAPNLHKIGIKVEWGGGHHYGRKITIEKSGARDEPEQTDERVSPASPASRITETEGDGGDTRDTRDAVLHTQPGSVRAPGVRPATNGKEGPGRFFDAQDKPTDDAELGYYARAERTQVGEAYQAATEKYPDAAPDQAKRETDANGNVTDNQQIEADPVPRQPMLVMQDSKEDAGLPPQVVAKQPDAVADVHDQTEKAPPAADVIEKAKQEAAAEEKQPVEPPAQPDQPVSAPDPAPATESSDLPPRPPGMLDGNYQRWLRNIRNQKAVQQFDAAMKERLH
jgi:hypothetical protein